MRFWRRPTLMINSALVVLLGGGGVWAWSLLYGDTQTQTTSSTARTAAVAQGQVTATVTASGSVASATTMNANFVTSGTVTSIKIKLGDLVTKGQTLAKVDDTETAESLATAKANLTAAKAARTRAKATGNADTIASAEKQVLSAQTAVDSAQRAQDGTTLKAPMAGTVVALTGTVGASSSGSSGGSSGTGTTATAFAQIADLSKLQVNASVPEADATRLKVGQAATVTWNALTSTRVAGTIASISPTSTTSGGVVSYPIVVSLSSVPEKAKLGHSVSLSVTVSKVDNVIYVPAAAVKTAGGASVVTVVVNGQQSARTVQIGLEGDSYTEITSGLTVGELVVIATVTSTTTTNPFGGGQFPGGGGQVPGGAGRGGGS